MKPHVGTLASACIGIWGCTSSFLNLTHHGNTVKSLTGYNTADGKIFLGAFIILGLFSLATITEHKRSEVIAGLNFIGGILIGVFAYRDFKGLNMRIEEISNAGLPLGLGASMGIGLFLVLAGAVFLVINSMFDIAKKPKVIPVKTNQPMKIQQPTTTIEALNNILTNKFDIYYSTMSKEELLKKLELEGGGYYNKDYLLIFYDKYTRQFIKNKSRSPSRDKTLL